MANRGRPPMLAGKEDEVIEAYLAGTTMVELAERFGCSDAPIIRILDAAGIERRRGRPASNTGAPRRLPNPSAKHVIVKKGAGAGTTARETKVRVPSTGPRPTTRIRDEVLARDGYRCRGCGSTTRLTVEYAIPPDRGGDRNNPKTLRTMCAVCVTNPVENQGGIGARIKGLFRR